MIVGYILRDIVLHDTTEYKKYQPIMIVIMHNLDQSNSTEKLEIFTITLRKKTILFSVAVIYFSKAK